MAGREDAGWVYYDPTSGGNGPPVCGKRRLIREEGFASRVSSSAGDPGGGTVPTVSPRRMTIDDVSHTMELLDGRPMEGITCPELLDCMLRLLDTTLDGGLIERISDWEPVVHPVPDATLDGRLMEGTTNPEPLEHSVLVGFLDSGLMEGMLSLESLEHDLWKESRKRTRRSVRLWRRNGTLDNRIWNRRHGQC